MRNKLIQMFFNTFILFDLKIIFRTKILNVW